MMVLSRAICLRAWPPPTRLLACCPPIRPSVRPSARLSVRPSIRLRPSVGISVSVSFSVRTCVCLPVFAFRCTHMRANVHVHTCTHVLMNPYKCAVCGCMPMQTCVPTAESFQLPIYKCGMPMAGLCFRSTMIGESAQTCGQRTVLREWVCAPLPSFLRSIFQSAHPSGRLPATNPSLFSSFRPGAWPCVKNHACMSGCSAAAAQWPEEHKWTTESGPWDPKGREHSDRHWHRKHKREKGPR